VFDAGTKAKARALLEIRVVHIPFNEMTSLILTATNSAVWVSRRRKVAGKERVVVDGDLFFKGSAFVDVVLTKGVARKRGIP